jgi:acyl carrier protein
VRAEIILYLVSFYMEEILSKIQKAFHESFGVEPGSITLETSPAAVPGWDSMGHLTLATNLEQAFGVSFDVDELMEMENVKAIVRIIQGKSKAA